MVDIATNSVAQPFYLVDASGNPISSSSPMTSAALVDNTATATQTNGTTAPLRTDGTGALRSTVARGGTYGAGMDGNYGSAAFIQIANSNTTIAPLVVQPMVSDGGSNAYRQRGDTNATFVKTPPLAKTASAVTAGSTTSQQLFAASATRSRVLVQNQDAAINVFVNVGATAVAGAGNLRIAPGATLELVGTSEAINLIAASGTPAICAWQF